MSLTPKDAYEIFNMEDAKENEPYAFSLSPPELTLTMKGTSSVYIAIHNWIVNLKQALIKVASADFEEIHFELSKKGRPHVHGYIIITDVLQFYAKDMKFLQAIGTYCIKKIGKSESPSDWLEGDRAWIKYITKQDHLYKKIPTNPFFQYNSKEIIPFEVPEKRMDIIRALKIKEQSVPKAD